MNFEEKKAIVAELVDKIKEHSHFYVTDIQGLNAQSTSNLRRKCFESDIELLVVKNTLLIKALEQSEGSYEQMFGSLKGNTAVMFTNLNSAPAKLIKEIRRTAEKPVLKAAYVEESIYVGDNQLDALATIKSKDELVGEIIGLLQSPIQNVLGAIESGKNVIGGLLKTLEERV